MRSEHPAAIAFLGDSGREGLALDGLYVPGEPGRGGALVAAPHPLMGGNMLHPVVTEVALRVQRHGIASLRFDWRGVGGSAGTPSGDLPDLEADYAASLAFLEESVEGPILAAGYSMGAITAMRSISDRPRVRRLLLVSPPAQALEGDAMSAFGGEVFIAVGDGDQYAPSAELEALAARAGAHFALLEDTDHFFGAGTAGLGRAIEGWLQRVAG